jgi:hypothetical protein
MHIYIEMFKEVFKFYFLIRSDLYLQDLDVDLEEDAEGLKA